MRQHQEFLRYVHVFAVPDAGVQPYPLFYRNVPANVPEIHDN